MMVLQFTISAFEKYRESRAMVDLGPQMECGHAHMQQHFVLIIFTSPGISFCVFKKTLPAALLTFHFAA